MPEITKVYLLRAPLEKDLLNTLYFTSAANQQAYFASLAKKSYTDFTYQRKDRRIRIPEVYDDIADCNYCMYQNTAKSNKWYYCFIDRIEYVNDGNSYVYIETDPVQTWLFDYTLKKCFVAREHVENDGYGLHTLPENVQKGDYIIDYKYTSTVFDLSTLVYVLGSTVDPSDASNSYGGIYNGIYSGVKYYRYNSVSALNTALDALSAAGKAEAVTGLFMVPDFLAPVSSQSSHEVITGRPVESIDERTLYVPRVIDGYTPLNNKLLTYPFCYLYVDNNNGAGAIYQYELFKNVEDVGDPIYFTVLAALAPGGSIRLLPKAYKEEPSLLGPQPVNSEGLNGGKFPICNYAVDMYTNWLTQNSVNIAVSYLSSGINMAGGVATGNIMGAMSGFTGILSQMGEQYKASLMPPQANGNLNSGDVTTAAGMNKFVYYGMSIKAEYARIIDRYFQMFGYQVNDVKTPAVAHRSRWWYTQTIDCDIEGYIPQDDAQRIKDAYNNGIRFWRNPAEMGNYDLTNYTV